MINDFLEVYLEDDQLWAAGGAAEIQALLAANIDDRGRLNGRIILQHLTASGVPSSAARVAMDRFVNKRRDRMGTSGSSAPTPRRDTAEIARPSAASPAPEATVSRGGVGVVSARQAEERTGRRSSPPAVSPSAPTASRVLPWGSAPNEEPTQTLHVDDADPDATHVAVSPTAKTEAPSPRPAAVVRPAAARVAEVSSPKKRSPNELRGAPAAEISSPGQSRPPEVSDPTRPSAARPALSPDRPSPETPSTARKKAATEIRGAPVAASVAAHVSSPGRPSPPKPAEAAVPAEMRAVLGMNRAEEEAKAQAKAAKEAARARLEEERAAAHNLHREARNPDAEKGPVDPGVFAAAAGALVAVLSLVFGGHPSPSPASFTSSPASFACSEVRAHAGELLCTLAEGAVTGSPESLRAAYASTRAEAQRAGYKGIWFFREDTGRVWHPPASPLALLLDAAPPPPKQEGPKPVQAEAAASEIDDVLQGLQVAPAEPAQEAAPPDEDENQRGKKARGKRKSKSRRK